MRLDELNLLPQYDSDENNVLFDFYIPVLSCSTSYKRLTGFFFSSSLAVAAKGISNLIKNGGSMKLICGAKLSKEDVKAIKSGFEEQESIIEKRMLEDLDSMEFSENEFIKDHVKALGWMIKIKKLELKIAVICDEGGNLLDQDEIERRGVFHQKVGIFEDKYGNLMSFSGSINESANAWTQNIEELNVFRSWVEGEKQYLEGNCEKFRKYWENNAKKVKVLDAPIAIKNKLIQIAPSNYEDLKSLEKYEYENRRLLRDYQLVAIEKWFDNNCRGIFQMATGTGKTITALSCLTRLKKEKGSLVVIIACPYQHLVEQWKDVMINGFGLFPIPAYGGKNSWEPKLNTAIKEFNLISKDSIYVVTTYKTLSTENFLSKFDPLNSQLLLIADESHHLGSKVVSEKLPDYAYRLGLTATPERWRDPEGTNFLKNYFEGVVFKFEISEAIKKGYLNEYLYKPVIVELTDEEINTYTEISEKISRLWYKYTDESKRDEALEYLYRERAKVLNTASGKLEMLKKIILDDSDLSYTLIYCHDNEQLEKVTHILYQEGYIAARITNRESAKQRDKVLKSFQEGRVNVLVAINCLDEGVDIPSTKKAFILASSGNPRQFIQRRGRLLRLSKDRYGKVIHKDVTIYDLISSPPLQNRSRINDIDQKILLRELNRFQEFCDLAKNEFQSREEIKPLLKKFKINYL